MKLLEFYGYIKLPDDFEGDEVDALQHYVDYRRKEHREKNYYEHPCNENKNISFDDAMTSFYNTLVESGKTRSGDIRVVKYENDKWIDETNI